jgi:hypothetical protein
MKIPVKYLLWLLFPTFLLCFMQCSEKEEPYVDIIGTWRLVETRSMTIVDHSNDRIIYEFNAGGMLQVAHLQGTPNWGPREGVHTYGLSDLDSTNWQGYTKVGKIIRIF